MVDEIRIYVEGGNEYKDSLTKIREGFTNFFHNSNETYIDKIHVIACGSRFRAYKDFIIAWESNSDCINILLVDSETEVSSIPCAHLKTEDPDFWKFENCHERHIHLMVQVMESWFLADKEALKTFYGNGFREEKLPCDTQVDTISKGTIEVKLKAATRNSARGRYHKINHAPYILELLDIAKVRAAAHHCDRLFTTLSELMGDDS